MTNDGKVPGRGMNRITANGAIVLSFIVLFEIVIMISPFAAFFYAVFNPFLLALNQSSATRWLTAFFLPHLIVPPDGVLVVVRILGSLFFVAGILVFLVCAFQVYAGKLFRKGTATGGLYVLVRHPQYVGLAVAALGLAVMWPRFLTLALLALMLLLYYILARDEERRMTNRFGESYTSYRDRTGMFLPRRVERFFLKDRGSGEHPGVVKVAGMFAILCAVIIGSGFILRTYTVHHLPVQAIDGVDVVAITSEDEATASDLVPSVLEDSLVAAKLRGFTGGRRRVLAYFIPIDYVMQGMIANTGDEWKLFEQHKTIGMITDYIVHPFAHLTRGHAHHMAQQVHNPVMHNSPAMTRRIIFTEVDLSGGELLSPYDDFGINVRRTPLFFVDVHLHTGEILKVRDTPSGSGWGTVPTPVF